MCLLLFLPTCQQLEELHRFFLGRDVVHSSCRAFSHFDGNRLFGQGGKHLFVRGVVAYGQDQVIVVFFIRRNASDPLLNSLCLISRILLPFMICRFRREAGLISALSNCVIRRSASHESTSL